MGCIIKPWLKTDFNSSCVKLANLKGYEMQNLMSDIDEALAVRIKLQPSVFTEASVRALFEGESVEIYINRILDLHFQNEKRSRLTIQESKLIRDNKSKLNYATDGGVPH